ncbi:MAG: hypothetical protein J0I06_14555 [Planctomycetes bacterium]|nr:hypothetical protein [Planctomycetota bacterium]
MSDLPQSHALVPTGNGYPAPLPTPITLGGVNEPIPLYSGAIDFTQDNTTFRAHTNIRLEWLPTPRIRFIVPEVPAEVTPNLGSVALRLDDGTAIERASINGLNHSSHPDGYKAGLSGLIRGQVIRQTDPAVAHVLFLLPNFEAPVGKAVELPMNGWRAARLSLIGAGWKITLDDVEQLKDVAAVLQRSSGYAITQIGRLEREDGKPFSAEEATAILDALGWYTSFACGRWTAPYLPHGYDATGNQVWQIWDTRRVVPYRVRVSWLDSCHCEHFETPFPRFLALWQNDAWEEVVRLAIHWYVEANAQAGSIEGAIVLTQTAFEMLSSFILVEQECWLAAEPCEKLPAADRIRLLLRWAGIPTDVPADLIALVKLAKSYEEFMLNKRPDTASAMTTIRNTITHPTRKNREKFGKHSGEARRDAWTLGLWALELCLLRLFNYNGTYACRIRQRWVGEVEQVPWVPQNQS